MGMSEKVRDFVGNALNKIYYEKVLGAGFEVTYVGFLEEDEDDEDDAYYITFKLKDKPESMVVSIVLYLDKDWKEDKIVVYDNCGEECYFEYNANDPISLYLLFLKKHLGSLTRFYLSMLGLMNSGLFTYTSRYILSKDPSHDTVSIGRGDTPDD